MNNLEENPVIENLTVQEQIQSRIFTIRGLQVMLDKDLAECYGVTTGNLNKAVSRNQNRFPSDFRFQLTKEEYASLRFQNGIIDNINGRGQHSKYLPYVFTEEGVGQLSAVLHSDIAAEVSVQIIRAFVVMRRFLSANAGIYQRIENVERKQLETDNKIELVLDRMEALSPSQPTQVLLSNGCVFDAWTYLSDLVRKAKKQIILIDNYCDERTLSLLTKRGEGVTATIYTRYSAPFETDLQKHNAQYPSAPIRFIQLSHHEHDRFLIIDTDAYILGDSLKNLGHSLTTILKTSLTLELILAALS